MKDINDNLNDLQAAWLRADISPQQKLAAKRMAKNKGMTFKGWLGQLILREINNGSATFGCDGLNSREIRNDD